MIVVSVLRSGGPYDPRYPRRLARGVEKYLPGARFVCLSDVPIAGVETIPLQHDWPRWWPKIEMFRPGLFPPESRVLYLDLDTLIVGDLTPLRDYRGPGMVLADLGRPRTMIGSGVLMWDAVPGGWQEGIYSAFMRDSQGIQRRNSSRMDKWLLPFVDHLDRVQECYPGWACSYKIDARKVGGVPPMARVLCFHGRPRPHEATGWAANLWRDG